MKSLFFLLASAFLITLTACDKDDCEATDLETTVVGEWNVLLAGIAIGQVEFHANGTLTDQTGVLVTDEIGGITVESKSWEVPSNSIITLTAANSQTSLETDVDVNSFECDEMSVTYQGTDLKLRRRD